jgi:hypothetical protein
VELEHFACSFVDTLLSPQMTTRQWRNRFKNPGISPHMYLYTYPFFQSSYVVYVKMPFHPPDQKRRWYTRSGHFYIGSTAISAVKRDFNRFAKLKQIWRNPTVHAELSVRYWSTRTIFESYTCIVLQACTTYDNACVCDYLQISSWQPALNHGFIFKNISNSNLKVGMREKSPRSC